MNSVATQPHNLPLLATEQQCSGRTYIVTGANTGIGLEAARHLVSLGAAKVIMGVRNMDAGMQAKADIEHTTGKLNVLEVWTLDLTSYHSVKSFAKKVLTDLDRMDALIENAGVSGPRGLLAEGHEVCLTVNVLSTLLLAVLLLPKMRESADRFRNLPRLVVVTSERAMDCYEDWKKIEKDPLVGIDSGDDTLQMYDMILKTTLMVPRLIPQGILFQSCSRSWPSVILLL